MSKQNSVVTNIVQDFNASEQAMARANIGWTNPDWLQTNAEAVDFIKNKPNLATVATSGDYRDLTNKPDIPSTSYVLSPVVYGVTTFDEVTGMIEDGMHLLLVDGNGNPLGRYKYSTSNMHLFERFPNVQPMWFQEFFLTSSGWAPHTFYVTDTAAPRVYTVDRVGTEYKQSDLPKMSFDITSYFSSTHWQYNGSDISGAMFNEFKTQKPQFVRYDYSTDLMYILRGAPAGTPTAVGTVELIMSRAETQDSPYVDEVQDWAPKIVIPFTDFADNGQGAYLSCQKPLNYSVTFDRERYESLFASAYYAYFWLRLTISNITPPGNSHDLRQVAAHSQYTFFSHV